MNDDCEHCEALLQPYLDRTLSDAERVVAEAHLARCSWCAVRYRFEEELRMFVRRSCTQPMPPALKQKLADLRTPLD